MPGAQNNDAAIPRRRVLAVLPPLSALVLVVAGVVVSDLGGLFAESLAKVSPRAVLASVPGQCAALLLFAGALRALCPRITFRGCLGARALRDAADNLLVIFPGFGEVVGARVLALAGARGREAVMVIVVDKLAEIAAQLPFMALAGVVLWRHWSGGAGVGHMSASLPAAGIAGLVVAAALAWLSASLIRASESLPGRLVARIREEFRLVGQEFHERKEGIPQSFALHIAARAMDGVQVWMIAYALNIEMSFFEAIVTASAAFAARALAFFIPAGLAVQEGGFIAAGLAFGISPPESLTLSLVLRLRDIVFGVPLLAWPLYEFWHGRRVGESAAH